ncbi:MAG: magnesium transporter [Planctomycetota bacterium]|jgi:magnesium transporter
MKSINQQDPGDGRRLEDLEAALLAAPEDLKAFLAEVHPADLAEFLQELELQDARAIARVLDTEQRAELLLFAEDIVREELLQVMEPGEIAEVVQEMPADEAVDLLALADEDTARAVLLRVDYERAEDLRELSRYDAETAGGLMTTEFISVRADARVADAIKEIKSEEGPKAEEELGVFVVDDYGRPLGFVSDRELLTTPIHTPITEVMDDDLVIVHAQDDQEDVAQLANKYEVSAVLVVDEAGVMIGVISDEDAQEVFQDEAEEDIRKLVGTSANEQTRMPVLQRVRYRIPLQALTVLGGLVTAKLLRWGFGSGDGALDVLRYLPIIIGLAGNVGIQSSTILVRAFATGEVTRAREFSVLISELSVGMIIGLLCGALTFALASQIEGGGDAGYALAGAVSLAIVAAVTWASLLGTVVPMACERLGIDPAVIAGPFLITLSDLSGTAIFVVVANALLTVS